MSAVPTAASPIFTDRPLSCISDPTLGGCDQDNWDLSPASGFYTVCCDGDILDITGFNSWENYTLLLNNLVCCSGENPEDRPMGPLSDEQEGCRNGAGTPLSSLLATSTEVAKPWTSDTDGSKTTIQPECFWSQLALDDMESVPATSAPSTLASTPTGSGFSATISQVPSSIDTDVSSSTASASQITSSGTGTAQGTTAASTGLAAAVALPCWVIPAFLLLSLGLNI